MWVCLIARTPGCSTALCSVPLHCTQARYFPRIAEVTICMISERLPSRPRQLPLHSLTAEAEGGYPCCSRTSAMPPSPSQRASRTMWGNGLPTTPTAAYLAAEGISPTTRPGRDGKRNRTGVLSLCVTHGPRNEVWWCPYPTNLRPPYQWHPELSLGHSRPQDDLVVPVVDLLISSCELTLINPRDQTTHDTMLLWIWCSSQQTVPAPCASTMGLDLACKL